MNVKYQEYQYNVALSFAGEDRSYVYTVAQQLKELGIKVFYDQFETANLWGKDLIKHMANIYGSDTFTEYVIIFISKHYPKKIWTSHELKHALSRASKQDKEFILPARFDSTEIPELPYNLGYIDISIKTPQELSKIIYDKLFGNSLNNSKKATNIVIPKILYSIGTFMAFNINEKYYKNMHYIWASSSFNNIYSSSPEAIFKNFRSDIKTKDRHSAIIRSNISGILSGALKQFKKGIITKSDYDEIENKVVKNWEYNDFKPIIYVIPTNEIKEKVQQVESHLLASPHAKEYIITELHREEFDIITID